MTARVEKWRPSVGLALAAIREVEPDTLPVLRSLGLSDDAFADVVLSLVQNESGGDPLARGDYLDGVYRSFGLMQINYQAAQGDPNFLRPERNAFGQLFLAPVDSPDALFFPDVNLFVGARYLLHWLNVYQDVEVAVLSYNAPHSTERWLSGELSEPVNATYLQNFLDVLGVAYGYFASLARKKKFSSRSELSAL